MCTYFLLIEIWYVNYRIYVKNRESEHLSQEEA